MATTIDTRLLAAVLPIAAATISRRRENSHGESFWERVHAVAPEPVWTYFCQIESGCQVALEHGAQPGWLEQHHPAFDDVLEGLARATSSGFPNRLAYVQGYTIQWATARLGMVYATERPGAGVTTSVRYDHEVQARASFELLGWTAAESHQHWADPVAFLQQWRSVYSSRINPDMLAKAGLFDAELHLLEEDA